MNNKTVSNPQGWWTVMARANMNGLRQVLGDDALSCIKGCKFQFKDSRKNMARKVGQEAGRLLKNCAKICAHAI